MAEQKDIEMNDCHFQIFVRVVTGSQFKTFAFNINTDENINSIAHKLGQKTGVPSKFITLSYQSKILYPNNSIKSYHILRESTLNATARCHNYNGSYMKNNDYNGICCASFPISLSNEQFTKKIKSISKQLNALKNEYKNKILQANNLCDLSNTLQDIQQNFNPKYSQLNAAKLHVFNQIKYNNNRAKSAINFELISLPQLTDHRAMLANSLEDIDSECIQTDKTIKLIENELECDQSLVLVETFKNELKKCEVKYKEWSTQNVITWLLLIENGKFNHNKYVKIKVGIEELEICGDTMTDLRNDSFLKFGFGLDLMERRLLLKNIDRVLNVNVENQNICAICIKQRINSVFIECGHQFCCWDCWVKEKERFDNCPICRASIHRTLRTFMTGF